MTLNGVMALILRHFTELGSSRGAPRKSGWKCRLKKFTFAISSPGEFLVYFILRLAHSFGLCSCGGRNCSRRATARLGIDTL